MNKYRKVRCSVSFYVNCALCAVTIWYLGRDPGSFFQLSDSYEEIKGACVVDYLNFVFSVFQSATVVTTSFSRAV